MKYPIRKVAVLGAGTMGSRIAAHLANAEVSCFLLDRVPPGLSPQEGKKGVQPDSPRFRNRFAEQGLKLALKSEPPAFYVPEASRLIRVGNFEDDLGWVTECDWIIEAVAENRDIKRALLQKVEPLRQPGCIVSSNTSGLSLASLAAELDADFRRHWLGTHFFNPPRYMKLLELIPTADTLPEVVGAITAFGEEVLGKGVVVAKDTPNFIANRIGTFYTATVLRITAEGEHSVAEIDSMTGPILGLPKSATFRTLDLVGLDVAAEVVRNLYQALPDDEQREVFQWPPFVEQMLQRKWLGEKTGQGFYRKQKGAEGSHILALDLRSFEYGPQRLPQSASLEMARNVEDTRRRVNTLFHSPDPTGEFYRKLLSGTFHYAASRIPEIADDIVSVDRALRWGFHWEVGVFELFDAVGVRDVVAEWGRQGRPVPSLVQNLLATGKESFYAPVDGKTAHFLPGAGQHQVVEEKPGRISLALLRASNQVVRNNAGASLLDLGDGVLCLEFHSKMNTLGADAVAMTRTAVKLLAEDFAALVIGNEAVNFSAGANLMLLLVAIQDGDWEEVDQMVRAFQQATLALKLAPKPVVTAPVGLTLGGGLEMALHSARIQAAAESYLGLVETGVGLIPAGGGIKEMVIRASESLPPDPEADPLMALQRVFETVGLAKVSSSAEQARRFGFLRASDGITLNRDQLIPQAKQVALGLARDGYRPAKLREDIPVFGRPILSALKLSLHQLRRAQFATDHDVVVGTRLADVLAGGPLTGPQKVSEQYLLDLEREAFLSLAGEPKTRERIQYMLKKGKPLRN